MQYIYTPEEGQFEYPVGLADLRAKNPTVSFRRNILDIPESVLNDYDFHIVHEVDRPTITHSEMLVRADPVQIDGVWHSAWDVIADPDYVASARRLSRWQMIAALKYAGIYDLAITILADLPETTPEETKAKIILTSEFEHGQEFSRNSPLVQFLVEQTSYTQFEVDELWMEASEL